MTTININTLKISLTYLEYLVEVAEMWQHGQTSTTGFNNSPAMLDYTADNLGRMYRLNDTTQLIPEMQAFLAKMTKPTTFLTITEGWCGDASQVVPVFEKIAVTQPLITHRIMFRDEHLDIMDAFLTEEGRSIPKLIVLDEKGMVLSSWGPRPQALQDMMMLQKAKLLALPKGERKAYFDIIKTEVQQWYNNDKTISIQKEILNTIGL